MRIKVKRTADKKLDTVLRSVKTKIEQTNDKELVCKVLKVEPEIKKAASKNNLSLARQAVYIKAQEKDIPITLDEVKTKPISDILRNISIQELDNNSKSGEGDVGSTDRKENTPGAEDNGIISKNTEQKTTHEQAETNETNTEANHKKPNVSNKKTAGGKTRKITVIPSPKTDEDSIETIRKISEPAVTEAPIEQSAPMDLTNKEKEATDRLNSSDIMITPDADIKTSSEQSPNLETKCRCNKNIFTKPTPSPSPAQSTIDTGINKHLKRAHTYTRLKVRFQYYNKIRTNTSTNCKYRYKRNTYALKGT